MIAFYQEPFSHWCVKARRILEYKKIPFTSHRVGYHDKQELIAATGQDYVPTLVDGAATVVWADVPDYLERLAPEPTIYPGGVRAVARALEDWAHMRLEDAAWRYVVPDMPQTFDDPRERWVFEEIQVFKRGPLEVLRHRRPEFEAELVALLGLLDGMLERQPFLLGTAPSLADFAAYGALYPLEYAGLPIPQAPPRVAAWYARTAVE